MWRDLLDSGAVVTNGTDAPVEDLDPIASYYSTVTRKRADGMVFYLDQRMTRMEALRSYTIACAYSAFEEDLKGSLEPGKLADVGPLQGHPPPAPTARSSTPAWTSPWSAEGSSISETDPPRPSAARPHEGSPTGVPAGAERPL